MIQSVDNKVYSRIVGHGRGWVFTPSHFKDMGSRTAVASALKRYKQNGTIRQIARGFYDYPGKDPLLGVLAPSIDKIMSALEERDSVRLQPSGAYAANLLGLSDQVPMRVVFLTDGPTRKLQIGNLSIVLKRTTPRNMATTGRISGTVIQALRWLGNGNVDRRIVALLKNKMDDKNIAVLMKDIRHAPTWIAEVFRDLAGSEE
jgi:hypothetical protein